MNKLEELKNELTEYKETHPGYDPESHDDFDFDVYQKVDDLENKIIELELSGYSFSEFNKFERYLINVGIRSAEYNYTDDELFSNIEYFKKCYKEHLSAYKALLFLYDYLRENEKSE